MLRENKNHATNPCDFIAVSGRLESSTSLHLLHRSPLSVIPLLHCKALARCCERTLLPLLNIQAHKKVQHLWHSDSLLVTGCHCTIQTLGSSSIEVMDTQCLDITLV